MESDSVKVPSNAVVPLIIHLLNKVQPVVINVILGKGSHWFWSFPQSQVAVVGLTDDQVVQLLWWGIMILNLVKSESSGVSRVESRHSNSRHS